MLRLSQEAGVCAPTWRLTSWPVQCSAVQLQRRTCESLHAGKHALCMKAGNCLQ
ncbi:hypothetical protein PILCRDRAFT_824576 [Piloderma croceum F 1598]|uniref:Uncharacterized protein n=1 Tax=Piloderma croceum (strain F 1598) TaxID=765440 RepID=A0A0C3AWH3_PILCF|nr:hypothetical protein PILCRDRAFT_824576 [Piloderma croceum F 1598]